MYEVFFVLEFSLSTGDDGGFIQFFYCSFHHTLISTKTKFTFLIENCYFNNALVFIQGAALIISHSVFENSEGSINHTILPQCKALFVLNTTFSEIKNCQFVNNKMSVIRLFNNINHNRNYRIIIMNEECAMRMKHTSITNSKCKDTLIKVFYFAIVHFQVINTIISNNNARNIIENDCYDFYDMFPRNPSDFFGLERRINCKGGIDLFYLSKCLFQGNVLKMRCSN